MADGSVKIEVGLNTSKAEKDLGRLKEKINKVEDDLNTKTAKRNTLEESLNAATKAADITKQKIAETKQAIDDMEKALRGDPNAIAYDPQTFQGLGEDMKQAQKDLAESEKLLKSQEKEVATLGKEYEKINQQVEAGEKNLKEMKTQAGEMVDAIEKARPGEVLARGLEQARKSMWKFLKYALGIRSVFFLWKRLRAYISDAIALYAEYDKETKYNLALMQATKKAVQGTFGSAFVQIYTALLPVIQKITNWMLEAANAAARFIAILSGKGSYKRAVVDAAEVAKSLEDSADAADETADGVDDTAESVKQLQRTLAPIDELNIIGGDNDGGLGAGKEKTEKEKAEKVAKTAIDGIKYVEESLETLNDSFLDKFALKLKDFLFDWDDLNPEKVAKRIIDGIGMLLGAALGIAFGFGPGGVLMMTIAGLLLAMKVNDILFDDDGKINRNELITMISMVVMGIVGAIAGFQLAPPGAKLKGALIGFIVGAGLTLAVREMLFDKDGKFSKKEALDMFLLIVNGIIGAIFGAAFLPGGGFAGAALGFGIATAVTLVIKGLEGKLGDNPKVAGFLKFLKGALGMLSGGLIGWAIGNTIVPGVGGIVGAVVGTITGAVLTVVVSSLQARLSDEAKRKADFEDSEFAKEAEEIKARFENILSQNADLTVHINSITGEVDESTMADLATAQSLINKIFTLDEKENKTSEEIAEIKGLIDTLNSMGLPNVFLQFDDATKHVNNTHEAMQKVLDDLLEQYRMEAMGEAYVESIKAQWDAHQKYKDALDAGEAAAKQRADAERDLASATEEYNDALKEYDQYEVAMQNGAVWTQQAGEAKARLETAKAQLEEAKLEVEKVQGYTDTAKQTIEETYAAMDTAAGKVSEIETAFSDMTKNMEEDGENAGAGWMTGWDKNADKIVSETGKTSEEILAELEKPWDFGSPSKTTTQDGEWVVEGFENGVRNKTPDAVNAVKEMMDQIFREFDTSIDEIKRLMNFSWSLPRPRIPQIGWNIKTVSYGRGQSVSIPQFFVNWYAKGGVFDFPSLIGVGESGKEAVVPLEKNTEWMSTVADGLMDRLKQANFANQLADAFMRTPMPAMAGGGIVPPGAIQGGGGFSTSGIEDAFERGIYNAMMAMGNNRRSGGFVIEINGREFMRAVYDDFKAVENEHGISMIET